MHKRGTRQTTPRGELRSRAVHEVRRYGGHAVVYILVNLSKTVQTVPLPRPMQDVLAEGTKQSVTLPVCGVAVLSASH